MPDTTTEHSVPERHPADERTMRWFELTVSGVALLIALALSLVRAP